MTVTLSGLQAACQQHPSFSRLPQPETNVLRRIEEGGTAVHKAPEGRMCAYVLGQADVGPRVPVPIYEARVECGFPSPAADVIEGVLDLNDLAITDQAATYFVRASGHSMQDVGIFDGDVLVVNRALEPKNGSIVIAALGGDMTVKRLVRRRDSWWLCPENEDYAPVRVHTELTIWGVVSFVLHDLR